MRIFGNEQLETTRAGLAANFRKIQDWKPWQPIAVGILGALMGLAVHTGVRPGISAESGTAGSIACIAGALAALLLWMVAKKLFLCDPEPGLGES